MAMNATEKTMIVEKTPMKQCDVNVKGQQLTQVRQYKYLGTTVENTGQCKTEVANKICQEKIAFWKKATILRSNISMKTRIRILMCCVFSVVSYGYETSIYSQAIDHKINAFEMWCYRRMLRIRWTYNTRGDLRPDDTHRHAFHATTPLNRRPWKSGVEMSYKFNRID